ncbi:MAG: hypothetical protein NC416_08150 [Eubacterium sp.]|nr:hypothetical protein [Eubacterium sp.]
MAAGRVQLKQNAIMIAIINNVARKKVFFILHSFTNVIRFLKGGGSCLPLSLVYLRASIKADIEEITLAMATSSCIISFAIRSLCFRFFLCDIGFPPFL